MVRVLLCSLACGSAWAQPPGFEGTWQGTLNTGAIKLRMGLHVAKDDKSDYTSKLDSIDQAVMGIPVRQTVVEGGKIKLSMPNMAASYEGTLSADGNEIGRNVQAGGGSPAGLQTRR